MSDDQSSKNHRSPAPKAGYLRIMSYPQPPGASKNQINKAGAAIADPDTPGEAADEAQLLVDQFRAAHTWPLVTVRTTLGTRAKSLSEDALVVQRLKRMPSIIGKLKGRRIRDVASMQDLGGCRAIMPNLDGVMSLKALYETPKKHRKFAFKLRNDYIEDPKPNGYRGLHFVGKYDSPARPEYKGYAVEIQLRTQLMHSWATAVEIVDTFAQAGLKSSDPNAFETDWDYFFAYASAAMAIEEGTAVPADMPTSESSVRKKLDEIDGRRLVDRIENWSRTMNEALNVVPKGNYYILSLDFENESVEVKRYSNAGTADQAYRDLESDDSKTRDSVLVAGGNISQIKAAYPNYFIDSGRFTSHMRRYTHE